VISLPSMSPLLRLWILMIIAIGFSYCFVDRPVCSYVEAHHWHDRITTLGHLVRDAHPTKKIQTLPPSHEADKLRYTIADWPTIMTGLAPFLLVVAVFLNRGKTKDFLILLGFSILFTFLLKNDLKWVFGRYWPLTWIHGNLSWIGNHAYGFQWFKGLPFQGDETLSAFPSGHTAVAFACMIPIGLVCRKLLPFCIAIGAIEGILMVVFNYHFISDVLAGALVGISCTYWTNSFLTRDKNPTLTGS